MMNPFSETLLNNVSIRRGTVSSCTPKRDLNKYDKLKNSKLSTVHSSKFNENCKKLVGDTRSVQPITKIFKKTPTPVKKDNLKSTNTFKNCIEISADQITPKRLKSRKLIFDVESPSALLRQRLSFADVEPFEEKEEESNKNLSPRNVPYNKLLKGIHVYVEIRDGVDNRSAAIRTVLCSMGATVHDNLNKKVTHVIFREGLTKTYNKAIQLKAHLLSILWVEAVRNAGHLVPESLYPASGLEAYSSPITSKKFQRIKSMQPDYDNTREKELERKVRRSFRSSMSRPANLTNFFTPENQDQVKKLMSPVCDNLKENGFESKVEEQFHQTPILNRKNKLPTNIVLSEKLVKGQKSYVKQNEDIIRDNALTNQQKKQINETSIRHSINILTQMDSISNTKSFQRRKSIRLLNKNK